MKKIIDVLFFFSIINFISFMFINSIICLKNYLLNGYLEPNIENLIMGDLYFTISLIIFSTILKYSYKYNIRITIEKKI